MPAAKKILGKTTVVIGLLGLAAVLYVLYQDTFAREAETKQVHERWAKIQNLAPPDGAIVLQAVTEGGAHYYGIDCHKLVILEITGMSRAAGVQDALEQIAMVYAKQFQEWHPELDRFGKSDRYFTVQGRAGLVNIEVMTFWYGDAAESGYQGPGRDVVLQAYTPEDGRGRRFAAVSMILCTRN